MANPTILPDRIIKPMPRLPQYANMKNANYFRKYETPEARWWPVVVIAALGVFDLWLVGHIVVAIWRISHG